MRIPSSHSLPNLPDVVDPGDCLRALRHALTAALGTDVCVSLRGAFNLCSARVNAAALEDALRQLALNARELMPRGGPLEVQVRQIFVPVDEAEVRAHCRANLTGYKQPRVVEFRTDLPKTPVGKILRRELRGAGK